MALRVLADGRGLYDASSLRGFGRYLRGLFPRVAMAPDIDLGVLVTAHTTVPSGVDAEFIRRRAPGRLADLEHRVLLELDLRRRTSDLYWSTGLQAPRHLSVPWVQTVYDFIPVTDPRPEHAAERRRWRGRIKRMRRADIIVAISEYAAAGAESLLGVDRTRIRVVAPGVDDRFTPRRHPPDEDKPFFLYVGEWGPSKGFVEAFDVVGRVARAGYPHTLKMVGRVADWHRPAVEQALNDSGAGARVDLLGRVDDEQLVELYQTATAVLVTSRAEGFCFPAAEGMASGTPVVAFDNTALPDTVGAGGTLVPDGDASAMAEAVMTLIADGDAWTDAAARARLRGQAFDWDASARAYVEIFRELGGAA